MDNTYTPSSWMQEDILAIGNEEVDFSELEGVTELLENFDEWKIEESDLDDIAELVEQLGIKHEVPFADDFSTTEEWINYLATLEDALEEHGFSEIFEVEFDTNFPEFSYLAETDFASNNALNDS